MEKNNLIITPKTKVLQLIETFPQLEEVLIKYVPTFNKLKNPVLRKTIAKIATLQQAATIGNIKIDELITVLRKEVGQDKIENTLVDEIYNAKQPTWFDKALVLQELDVREMLSRGEHPVNQVISDLSKLPPRMIYKLTASFVPAPLIDKAKGIGILHWIVKEKEDLIIVYFFKQ
jgi:hypothetical protein